MNKQKFVEYLRAPESLDEQQFDEFKQLLVDHPYFSIAKTIAARAAKNLNDENKGDLITTAAIYATDRKRLKKYISGDIIFLTDKPKVSESEPEAPITQKAEPEKAEVETQVSASTDTKNLTPPTTSDVDQILDELEHDMEELRKSRMHFAEIQSQLDEIETPQKTVKEEIKEKPDANDVSGKEKVSESDGKDKEERDKSLSGLMIDLEALKKEFEQEESKGEPKSSAKSKNVKPDSEEAESLASSNEKESTPPKSKNIVTNMSEGEENDDNEPGYFDDVPEPEKPIPTPRKKKPARADRDSRMKVKRSELDQMMGLKSIPKLPTKEEAQSKEETPKKATKKKTSTAKKPTAKKAAEDPEEKPKPKPATKKKSATKKTTAKSSEEKKVKSTTTTRASSKKPAGAKKASDSKGESKPKKPAKKDSSSQEDPGSDPVTRATRKALLDFGKAEGLSMSVSRASSSKRRRKSKGKSGEEGTAKKDDDESGGAGSLIDKFIEENPSISRKVTSPNKEDLSEKSTSWQDDIASEYLAEIYLKQGNKERARKIYQTLSLKFPEKKSYFAGLIEKLEE